MVLTRKYDEMAYLIRRYFVEVIFFTPQVHTAEIGTRDPARKADGLQRNRESRLSTDDRRLWELCHSEVFRIWLPGRLFHAFL